MSLLRNLVSIGLLLLVVGAFGQKHNEQAEEALTKGFYFEALELYKKAYTTEKDVKEKARLIFMVGECYRALGDAEQQQVWYEKANKARYPDPITYLYIGEALKEQGKYAEAVASYKKYKEKNPGDLRADAGISASEIAQQWTDDPTRYTVSPEVLLNTQQYDYTPTFSDKKNNEVIFASTRQGATGSDLDDILGENFSDLFVSKRDKLGKWSEPVKLGPEINTEANEAAAVFNKKRTLMFFTRCEVEKKAAHGCNIWVSKKIGRNYSDPQMLALAPDDAGEKIKGEDGKVTFNVVTVGHPTLTPDEKTLIFASNMKGPGAMGGKDLWKVGIDKKGELVGKPVNLGAGVNTSGDELFPHVRMDSTLYFSSNGLPNMGGMDIYSAEKNGDTWSNAVSVKAPINSPGDDFALVFDGEHDRGFFTSNRVGGKGQDDIWRFLMPDMVFALQGTVLDKDNGTPIEGVTVEVVGTDGSSFSAITDEAGGFNFEEDGTKRYINESTTYSIRASKPDHLVVKDQITTVGLEESTTFVKEYYMQYTSPDKIIQFPEVQYVFARHELTPAGQDSLDFLYQTLADNPTIVIELNAHTDSRGSNANNQALSDRRAQSCVNYLITKGIEAVRMVPKGLGETKLRISDKQIAAMQTEEEREAAHQQNRRTEFRVLRWDHVPAGQEISPGGSN